MLGCLPAIISRRPEILRCLLSFFGERVLNVFHTPHKFYVKHKYALKTIQRLITRTIKKPNTKPKKINIPTSKRATKPQQKLNPNPLRHTSITKTPHHPHAPIEIETKTSTAFSGTRSGRSVWRALISADAPVHCAGQYAARALSHTTYVYKIKIFMYGVYVHVVGSCMHTWATCVSVRLFSCVRVCHIHCESTWCVRFV